MMIDSISEQTQSMMNDLTSKTGIYTTISVSNVIEVSPNLDYNTMSLNMGECLQLFEGWKNKQRSRSVGEVTLNPSNEKGGYCFTSLRTGRKLHVFIWT